MMYTVIHVVLLSICALLKYIICDVMILSVTLCLDIYHLSLLHLLTFLTTIYTVAVIIICK